MRFVAESMAGRRAEAICHTLVAILESCIIWSADTLFSAIMLPGTSQTLNNRLRFFIQLWNILTPALRLIQFHQTTDLRNSRSYFACRVVIQKNCWKTLRASLFWQLQVTPAMKQRMSVWMQAKRMQGRLLPMSHVQAKKISKKPATVQWPTLLTIRALVPRKKKSKFNYWNNILSLCSICSTARCKDFLNY